MKIGIVGLGLIGGSLGIDLRRLGHRVIGISRKKSTCIRACEMGAVDEADVEPSLIKDVDVAFICTPLGVMESVVEEIIPYLKPSAILTDVGSVKEPIVEAIGTVWTNYVGGHPMAGLSENGIDSAVANLFKGAPYVLTPTDATTPSECVSVVAEIARDLGSIVYTCSPSEHDRAVAWISHLPVFVSASLIEACLGETDESVLKLAKHLASSGFKDTSRVGSGNPELGVMMAVFNKVAILHSLGRYRETLDKLISRIENEEWEALGHGLDENQIARPEFLRLSVSEGE